MRCCFLPQLAYGAIVKEQALVPLAGTVSVEKLKANIEAIGSFLGTASFQAAVKASAQKGVVGWRSAMIGCLDGCTYSVCRGQCYS